LLPTDEAELRAFIPGAGPALDRTGLSATELVARAASALDETLGGRHLALQPLGEELAARLAHDLTPEQHAAWDGPPLYAARQTPVDGLTHVALYPIALQGRVCLTPPRGRAAQFALTAQWLGAALPEIDPAVAGGALVQRFLRCYGPSTA